MLHIESMYGTLRFHQIRHTGVEGIFINSGPLGVRSIFRCYSHISVPQLLKGVTIASGGVLPNIHPDLLKKRKGGKLVPPEELKPKKPKTNVRSKPVTSGKKISTPAKKPASPAKKAPISAGKGKKKGVGFQALGI